MKNPLELIIDRRNEIMEMYTRVYGSLAYDLATNENRAAREMDLVKLKEMLDEYEATIRLLKELNHLEYEQ